MHGHAVRMDRARDAILLVRRVRDHPQFTLAAPAVDRLPALDPLHLLVEERGERRLGRPDAEIREPSREQTRIDGVFLRECGDRGVEAGGRHLGAGPSLVHGGKACGRSRSEPLSLRSEHADHWPHQRQWQIIPARGHEPRVLPNDDVVIAAVARITSREMDRDRVLVFRHRQLHAEFLPVDERRHRLHPGGRAVGRAKPAHDRAGRIELP